MGNWEFFFFKAFVCLYMSVNFTIKKKKTKQNKKQNSEPCYNNFTFLGE